MMELVAGCVVTRHAREVVQRRAIPLEWLHHALSYPNWLEMDAADDQLCHYLASIPEFGNRVLRVVVNVHKHPPHIVTAFFDRRRMVNEAQDR